MVLFTFILLILLTSLLVYDSTHMASPPIMFPSSRLFRAASPNIIFSFPMFSFVFLPPFSMNNGLFSY